ncbi:hypothetical protein CBM2587_A230177 [Cupriavidus taiwanensis]|uniref:Uncharacterized protein n=1 Tax=Cupriavidus taiwanensis TaxID=164546 RepID=A0A375BRU3_9BURK|nr:hypothetical protein CBM2587_A230177 [Cupriavidus taiwanensis]
MRAFPSTLFHSQKNAAKLTFFAADAEAFASKPNRGVA